MVKRPALEPHFFDKVVECVESPCRKMRNLVEIRAGHKHSDSVQ